MVEPVLKKHLTFKIKEELYGIICINLILENFSIVCIEIVVKY